MLNRATIMGRFVRDPELRSTNDGKSVCSFTIACDRDRQKEATDFIDCVAWEGTAEFVSKYFSKGKLILVSGRLQIRDWIDKDGNKRRSAEIVCQDVYFCDDKKKDVPDVKYEVHRFTDYNGEEDIPF